MNASSQARVIKKLQIASSALDDATKMLREQNATSAVVLSASAQRYVADAILKVGGSGDEAISTREAVQAAFAR